MLRITKSAVQVTATEAHKDNVRPGVEALALKRVEYFVYLIHGMEERNGEFYELNQTANYTN